MENRESLSKRKEVVKGASSHSPGEESSGEGKGSAIPLCAESGRGKTSFLRVD